MTNERLVAHIDMDAFFASCELSQYPELRGVPMVVAGHRVHGPYRKEDGSTVFAKLKDYEGRGVLTTATYEARALGLHSGMPAMRAAKLAPGAVMLPVNFELYRKFSRLFKDAVRSVSPVIEDIGIDEVYADVTEVSQKAEKIGFMLRDAVFDATGLTCSVGLAPNKLLAKICSDIQKPNGVTVISFNDVPSKIWPMPARCINGIGPKASEKLSSLGISTIGEIAACEEEWLVEKFGRRYGLWLFRVSRGLDERPLITNSEPVSVSRETTFDRNLHSKRDHAELGQALTSLCEKVGADLQRKGFVARTIGIKLRFDNFMTVTRDLTLGMAISDATSLRRASGKCLQRVDLTRSIRLLGVRATALERADVIKKQFPEQMTLELG